MILRESSHFRGHDRGLFDKISGCFRLNLGGSARAQELPLTAAQQGRVWEKRGVWWYRRGQPEVALEAYGRAISLLEQAGGHAGLAVAYNNIVNVHYARGSWAQRWHCLSAASSSSSD
jgi:hypothetical protein